MNALTKRVSASLDRTVSRLGPWPWSIIAGVFVVVLSSFVALPAWTPSSPIGTLNVQLAADPFGTAPNAMAPRILTPLLSWTLGLRGEGLLILIAVFCVLLPTVVARWALARGFSGVDALMAACVPGLTLLVRTSLHYGGVTDVVTYLLVFGIWIWRARPRLVTMCFLLALLNHERVLFLLPWIVWLVWREGGADRRRRWTALAGIVLAVLIWAAIHVSIVSHREVEQNAGYYLQPLLEDPLTNVRLAWPRQPLGFLSAFQWVWLLPLCYASRLWRRGDRAGLTLLVLPLLCAWAQMFFAYDSSRLAALAFPCLLPALEAGLRDGGPGFRFRLMLLVLLQMFTPQVFTASYIVEVMPGWL